ncbi:L-iditol 2-dehydrogenase [Anaerobacterium chartisolvens]|uniref:L-iditol 2-dehydrogenase n=2 Tax=Anaerobacterium chartisolvens TaxID=1297424 RepID=A0A369B3L5_9FIRM|nr:L-iditol 2-dehydrogenase [Anaerobacterium chartisolvens]
MDMKGIEGVGGMDGMMKVAMMNKPGRFDFEQKPIPKLKPDCVLVKLEYVGICGSDMHLFEHGYIGENYVKEPMVLGHEPGGIVAEVGSNVSSLKVGDRVAVEPGVPCWHCEFCKSGKYNLCRNVYFYASLPVVEGCFAEYIAHPANLCYKLPDNVSTMEGALMEPLAVGMHAVMQSGIRVGSNAVVIGAGCIGIVTMLSLKSMGIRNITVVDLVKSRLDRALELGAANIVDASETDAVKKILELTCDGAEFVFETAGSEVSIFQTAKMVKRGGTITLVGYTKDGTAKMNVNWIIDNEVTVKTVFRYRNIYPLVIEAVSGGIIPLRKIASDIYDFNDIQTAMENAINNKDTVMKCVVRISPDAK